MQCRNGLRMALLLVTLGCGGRSAYDAPSESRDDAAVAGGPEGGPSSSGASTSSSGGSGGVSSASSGGSSGSDDASDTGSQRPSCAPSGPGTTDCGSVGSGSESCCTSLEVTPNGPYYRTYANSGSGPSGEADPATVSAFRLDKYLVTVGRFRQFVNAVLPPDGGTGWVPLAGSGKHTHLNDGRGLAEVAGDAGLAFEPGWAMDAWVFGAPTDANLSCSGSTWTSAPGSQENLPINCVNWFEAYAFCIWDGGFLPSEAEWEYAAAGGSEQREYPWGSTPPGTNSEYAIYGCYYPDGSGVCTTSVMNIAPVGTAASGGGLWGQLDLAGNLSQWNLDWYASGYVNPCADCAQLLPSSDRVFRGGSFLSAQSSEWLPPDRGSGGLPTGGSYDLGFRCALTP